jgi:predicted transcriptional regulator
VEGTFRPRQPGLRKLLGDLEAEVMEVVWSHPDGCRITVREVYERLLAERKVAYTTVMTVMGNLAKKDVLRVEKDGPAYTYFAPLDRAAFTERAVGGIVADLLADFSDAALAHFHRALESHDDGGRVARLRARVEQAREAHDHL